VIFLGIVVSWEVIVKPPFGIKSFGTLPFRSEESQIPVSQPKNRHSLFAWMSQQVRIKGDRISGIHPLNIPFITQLLTIDPNFLGTSK